MGGVGGGDCEKSPDLNLVILSDFSDLQQHERGNKNLGKPFVFSNILVHQQYNEEF